MNFETVKFELSESVAILTLNRPEALNSLSLQLVKDLREALRLTAEHRARAAVLTGAGRAFCAGGDLREMQAMAKQTGNLAVFFEEPLENLHGCISLIRELPIPFVAAVNGVCAGAGTNFALACDIVFAGENASFNEGFVKIGLSPDCGGSYFLPRLVGEKIAAELLMTGDTVSAKRAAEIGMINRVVGDSDLMTEALKFAQKLAAMPTGSIGRIKKMLAATATNDLQKQLELEHRMQIESGQSADFKEGVSSFFEKRPPVFRGD
ncbi:MAG TPA: enoyl-CoA hydratase-related protein [Pyrinomonadaceae bacterium]|nr:enoyl-CoA hydratase-related protein [Pyrinomonadaceae bacterium]